jgi:site-specific DNA-cytosine methylase
MQLRFFTPREVANLHGLPPPRQDNRKNTSQHPQQQQQQYQQLQGDVDDSSQDAAFCAAPAGFSFPPGVRDRQAYALLGNSLSVDVVALLMGGLLEGWVQQHAAQQQLQQQQQKCC